MPCLILVDVSASMRDPEGNPAIHELVKALKKLKEYFKKDVRINSTLVVATVLFGGRVEPSAANLIEFKSLIDWSVPELTVQDCYGDTPLAHALLMGLHKIRNDARSYHAHAVRIIAPLVYVFTDGKPTDKQQFMDLVAEYTYQSTHKRHMSLKFFCVPTSGVSQQDLYNSVGKFVHEPSLHVHMLNERTNLGEAISLISRNVTQYFDSLPELHSSNLFDDDMPQIEYKHHM